MDGIDEARPFEIPRIDIYTYIYIQFDSDHKQRDASLI
jgi:hypothetical protein